MTYYRPVFTFKSTLKLCKTLRKKGEKSQQKITVRGKKIKIGVEYIYTPVYYFPLYSVDCTMYITPSLCLEPTCLYLGFATVCKC